MATLLPLPQSAYINADGDLVIPADLANNVLELFADPVSAPTEADFVASTAGLGGGTGGAYTPQLTPDQVAALQAPGASANNLFVLNDDYRLDPNLLHLLPIGVRCYMYGPDDGSNQYGLDGTGIGHEGNVYGFGMSSGTFNDQHSYNTYGDGLQSCDFGYNHFNNHYGAGLRISSFGNNHSNNTYGSNILRCIFRDNQKGNEYGNSLNQCEFGANNQYNIIGDDCAVIITRTGVTACEVGPNCANITFGANCKNVKVFDTRQDSSLPDPTGSSQLVIPAGTQNAVYRRGVLEQAGAGGTARDPYDVDTAKRKEVVDANVPAYLETDSSYYGKEFVDEVYGPGQPAYYKCMPSAPAMTGGATVWKWFRIDIL
jgi:hypothetical protein